MATTSRKTEYFTAALSLAGGVLIAYLCFRVFRPFLAPTVWAIVLGVLLHPLYEPLERAVRSRSLAAVLLCLLAAMILGLPFIYLVASLPSEIKEAYTLLEAALNPEQGGPAAQPRLLRVWSWVVEAAARAGYHLPSAL